MANKYAVASGLWSATSTWSDTDGGGAGAAVPADGDAVFILINISVQMDVDQSAFTGLNTVTIRGHATTPAMLYWKDGASGWLKIRTAFKLVGTSGAAKGRLLANSNGTWGATTPMANTAKATIDLQATAYIDAQYLDIALYGTNPTKTSVRTYKTKFDFDGASAVDPVTNIIDLGVAPPTAGTAVMVTTAAGTLPVGLQEDYIYYVRTVSGNTCKLATQNADAQIVDITADGSGTCTLFTGHTDTATGTMNVLDDVTADAPWTTTDLWDRVVLASRDTSAYDQQRLQLTTINAGSLVLSANVDSVQSPGARVWLASRNVQILSTDTGTAYLVDYQGATTAAGVFRCAIINTAGTGTTFYSTGIQYGTGHTVSGSISGCTYGVVSGTGHTVSGSISGCTYGVVSGTGHTVSGSISGCSEGINSGTGHTVSGSVNGCTTGFSGGTGHTISGSVSGCSYGINYGTGFTVSGSVSGCNLGLYYGTGHTVSGSVSGCNLGLYYGTGHTVSGSVSGCTTGIQYGTGHTISGSVSGCSYGINYGQMLVVTGRIGYTSSEDLAANTTDFTLPIDCVCRGALLPTTPVFVGRNDAVNYIHGWGGVYSEDHGRTLGASKAWLPFGTVTKQTGTIRTGGASSALQVDPQTNCGSTSVGAADKTGVLIFEWTELAVAASAQTRSVYMRGFGWTAWPTAAQLYFEVEYISNATTFARTTVASTAVLTDNTTWVQFPASFTPAAAAHVRYRAWLKKYEASSGVYVDAQLS